MRKQDSFFNEVATFINSIPVGETFTSAQYINAVGDSETVTRWKIYSKNKNYRSHQYKGMLKGHFLQHVKRGTWKVTRHIPEWFTTAHLWTLNWHNTTWRTNPNLSWDHPDKHNATKRCLLTRDEIIAKLEDDTNINVIFHKIANSIADESIIGKATPEDPMYYASGTYVLEKAVEGIPDKKITMIAGTSELVPQIKVTKIEKEESQFYINENRDKEVAELYNNIRENVGLVRAATHIMDQVRILDPLVQGRAVNIFEQLQSLLIAMESRIISNTPKQSI